MRLDAIKETLSQSLVTREQRLFIEMQAYDDEFERQWLRMYCLPCVKAIRSWPWSG